MRSLRFILLLAAFLLGACVATPQPVPTAIPTDTPVPPSPVPTYLPQRAPLLRIAILGEANSANVWALFDQSGTDYWNYATQADYWPRLYHLAPPSFDLEPATAKGWPSPIVCDNSVCSASVSLQPNQTWTDGSAFTAADVAFTANTVLQFRLGLNWRQAYNPDVLDFVEALNESTVKFYFKGMPSVADWQYGVLQGPILNRDYWEPRIAEAIGLLPEENKLSTIRELEAEFTDMQSQVNDLSLSLNGMAPDSTIYRDTSKQAQGLQDELNSIYNKLEKNRSEYDANLAEARTALFSLAHTNEPTLGPWKFTSQGAGIFENGANLETAFGNPWFDSVRYSTYDNEAAAVSALLGNEVDLILTPTGLSPESLVRLQGDSDVTLNHNATRNARFLAFNHSNPYLADPILHQGLACMLDLQALAEGSDGGFTPLTGFVLDAPWKEEKASLPCAGRTEDMRLAEAVKLLKSAGYSWSEEPAPDADGTGLTTPDGVLLPRFSLLAPGYAVDAPRAKAAIYIAHQASKLGLSLDVRLGSADELLYDVYGSGGYDMALLGWSLSVYPAYLCDWFTPVGQNPFAYNGSNLQSVCEALEQTSDMQQAKAKVSAIQSILLQDLPLIPLYVELRYDGYRNVRYPFDAVIGGLAGLYGAPALAIPIQRQER